MRRLEVGFKKGERDVLGENLKREIREVLGLPVLDVKTSDVYTIGENLRNEELSLLAKSLFCDPVVQDVSIGRQLRRDYDWMIEIGLKPGVTDNVGKTAKIGIEEILKRKLKAKVYTSKRYFIYGKRLKRKDVERIARHLANDLIQRWLILGRGEKEKGLEAPEVKIFHQPRILEISLDVSDEELLRLSEKRSLALNLEEMKAVKAYFSRPEVIKERKKMGLGGKITDAELEGIAQTWSEHCKHKIFNAKIFYREGEKTARIDSLFKTFIKRATEMIKRKKKSLVSVFWDNSGVIEFNKDWLFCFKCETHNSPSNEEPYGGALTGIVGVYRDIMGTGRGGCLIYGTYGFCVGNPFYSGVLRPKFHPRRLLEGVRKGVEDGGNKSGVPTIYGLTFFDNGYIGKPAIFVSAGGLIPKKIKGRKGWKKEIKKGDLIVMAGGRVGADGIHGATQSSLEAGDWISASHVQLGDPFTQKKLHDFLIEARDRGLFSAITDNGAGGLSSSVGEMARLSGGFELHLDKVPLKYTGLDPWQILLSESQERMTLAVSPKNIKEFRRLAKKHDVETTVIGRFDNSGRFYCSYKGKSVALLDMDFIHEGVPQMKLEAEWKTPEERGLREPELKEIGNHNLVLEKMLSRPNIALKEYITRQFDHEVQGTSVIKFLVGREGDAPSDAAVIKPLYHSNQGLAVCSALNPDYGLIDTYWMTALTIDEAIRRIVSVGGSLRQIALNDNFCWPSPLISSCNPEAKYKLAQLVRAVRALYDFTLAFGVPCISGKDSMSMDGWVKNASGRTKRISALPTLQISAAGKIKDIRRCITMDVKEPGDLVYVLGMTKDELGGSEYYKARGKIGLNVPKPDAEESKKLYKALGRAIEGGLVNSCHGVYKGGIGVSLAQISIAGGRGIEIELGKIPFEGELRPDKILYSESAGRFLASVSPKNKEEFERTLKGSVFSKIGRVRRDGRFKVFFKRKLLINQDISRLRDCFRKTFSNF